MKRVVAILLFCLAVSANAQHRAEFIFGGYGGVAPFVYTSDLGKSKMGFTAGGDLSIGIMFNKFFGIKIGAGASFYNTSFNIPQIGGRAAYWDGHNNSKDTFIYEYSIDNFDEKITLLYGMIPVMFCVQTPGKAAFSFAAGAKIGIPIKTSNTRHIDHLKATWFYPSFDVGGDSSTWIGFGNFYGSLPENDIASIPDVKGNVRVGLMVNVTAELGLKVRLGNKGYFYVLLYGEYGVLNTLDKKRELEELILWDSYTANYFKKHSVSALNGYASQNDERVPIVKSMIPLSFGLKLGFGIGLGSDLSEPGN